jgi:hypothetical protein
MRGREKILKVSEAVMLALTAFLHSSYFACYQQLDHVQRKLQFKPDTLLYNYGVQLNIHCFNTQVVTVVRNLCISAIRYLSDVIFSLK